MGDSSKSIRRIQPSASPFPWADSISVGAGFDEREVKTVDSVTSLPQVTQSFGSTVVNAQAARNNLLEDLQKKLNDHEIYVPRNGFKVATPETTSKALELIEIWDKCTREWNSFVGQHSQNQSNVPQEFFRELSTFFGSAEPYSHEAFNNLLLYRFTDYLAECGFVLSTCPKIIVPRGVIPPYYMYLREKDDFTWIVKNVEKRTIKVLDGNRHEISVAHVEAFTKATYETEGFSKHGTVFVNDVNLEKKLTVEDAIQERYRSTPVFRMSFNVSRYIENIDRYFPADNPGTNLLRAAHFSLYKLLEMLPESRESRIAEYFDNLYHHEGEHDSDDQNLALRGKMQNGFYDLQGLIFSEFRARANEFNVSIGRRLLNMLRLSYEANHASSDISERQKLKLKEYMLSEYLIMQALVKLISKNPAEFGILVFRDPTITASAQILGQLYKLAEGNNPKLSRKILDHLKPLTEDPEKLLAQIDPEEPFYKYVLEPKLPR